VVVHGSPWNGGSSWITPELWQFMDRPYENGGASWIALGVVEVHGSPPEKRRQFMDRPRTEAERGYPSVAKARDSRSLRAVSFFCAA